MSTDPNRPPAAYELERQELVTAVGETAVLPVVLASPEEIQDSLNRLGTKSRWRRQKLFPELVALGGQSMSCVDLVLNVRDIADRHKPEPAGDNFLSEFSDRATVSRYLEIVTGEDADEAAAETIRQLWGKLIESRNGTETPAATKKKNPRRKSQPTSSFSKGKPAAPSVKPKQQNTRAKRKKAFDTSRSDSFRRSAQRFNKPD